MHEWRLYYSDGSVVRGTTGDEWRAAPDDRVQVVVLMRAPERPRWTSQGRVVTDRLLWTGEDSYNPFGWGTKRGSLISDKAYRGVWVRACGDD